ncbi:MAG: hypothetical protein AB1646_15335 [Thermodesulfobacteriota bacterium]
MGILSRSVSMMRYRVRGDVEGSFWDAVHEGIKAGAFREIESPGDEIGLGWVSVENFTQTELPTSSYLYGRYVVLSLRMDGARVPPRALELRMQGETRLLLEQTGQKRLSTRQRRDLKDRLKESLKKQVLPNVQVFDLIWDTSNAVLYFGSLSVKSRDKLEAHFKKCFGLTLVPLIPFLRAQELLADKAHQKRLEDLKPCSLVP